MSMAEPTAAVEQERGEGARGERASPAIELAGLRREFGDRIALAGIDARLERGRTLAVLGPNGSGKTTLLRILAGLLRPTAGDVRVLGRALPRETHLLRGRVGYLGHDPLLYRDLSARENLRLGAALHGLETAESEARIDRLLGAVGMDRRADEPTAVLSAGMRQRIDICRAVLHQPELLLLDEPGAHLDDAARVLMEPLIGPASERTRVIASHDAARARESADAVLELG